MEVASGLPVAYQSLLRQPVTIPAEGVDGFLARELPALAAYFDLRGLEAVGASTSATTSVSREIEISFILRLEGSLNYLAAQLEAQTAKRRATLTSPGYRPVHPAEAAALQRLRRSGFDGPTPKGELVLRGEHDIL